MISRLTHAPVWVLDQDDALRFYTEKLGFEVRTDQSMDEFRWVTVCPRAAGPRDRAARPRPADDGPGGGRADQGARVEGQHGPGVFATDDCRATYEELSARGVEFMQEPTERSYGIEVTFRDNSGNWFSLTAARRGPPRANGRARRTRRHGRPQDDDLAARGAQQPGDVVDREAVVAPGRRGGDDDALAAHVAHQLAQRVAGVAPARDPASTGTPARRRAARSPRARRTPPRRSAGAARRAAALGTVAR